MRKDWIRAEGIFYIIFMIEGGSILDEQGDHLNMAIATGKHQRSPPTLRALDISPRLKISLHLSQVPDPAGSVNVHRLLEKVISAHLVSPVTLLF
jgi:hypothetical protein